MSEAQVSPRVIELRITRQSVSTACVAEPLASLSEASCRERNFRLCRVALARSPTLTTVSAPSLTKRAVRVAGHHLTRAMRRHEAWSSRSNRGLVVVRIGNGAVVRRWRVYLALFEIHPDCSLKPGLTTGSSRPGDNVKPRSCGRYRWTN